MNEQSPPSTRRQSGRTMTVWGGLSVCSGLLLLVSPALLGRGGPVKYLLAAGFLAFCLGWILVLLGAVDWWRGDRK